MATNRNLELIAGAERNDLAALQRHLKDGADVGARDRLGCTALLAAIVLSNGGPRH